MGQNTQVDGQMAKNELRDKLLSARLKLDKNTQEMKSRQICIYLRDFIAQHYPTVPIATYVATQGECEVWQNLMPLIPNATYLPAIVSWNARSMEFFKVSSLAQCRKNKIGIWEPNLSIVNEHSDLKEPALFLIPGVGFDYHGGRLGFGGGFYDRYLVQNPSLVLTTVGVGYGLQYLEAEKRLPIESFDIAMKWLVNEEGVYPARY